MVQAGDDEQEQPDGDRDAGQDRSPGYRPEVRRGCAHGLAEGQVGAAVAHVLHGLDQRRLQEECRDDLHQGAEHGPDRGAAQCEERGDDRGGQVDDEGDGEQVPGVRLVHLPRFAENARQWVHGGDGTAKNPATGGSEGPNHRLVPGRSRDARATFTPPSE